MLRSLGRTGSGYAVLIKVPEPEDDTMPPTIESVGSLPSKVRIEELGAVTNKDPKSSPYSAR
jgi:hypothetical protein